MHPMIAEDKAITNTPDAPISLINFISGRISGLIKLDICSIAVLKISAVSTIPIQIKRAIHSAFFNLKKNPKTITSNVAMIWILKFISDRHIDFNPANA